MLTIKDMHLTAEQRNGKCLSQIYVNNYSKLTWQCNVGHVWQAKPNNIRNGQWCPICSSGLRERICRAYFEQLFNNKFPKLKPAWLKNSNGFQMELDGYCESLSIAFEHNGRQHYTIDKTSIFKDMDLNKRILDDKSKISLCEQHGIILIVIPELIKLLPIPKLPEYIKEYLYKLGREDLIPEFKKIDLSSAYISEDKFRFENMKELAKSKNGELLSDSFLGTEERYKWKCNICNYEWETLYDAVMRNKSWCPKCAKLVPPTTQEINNLANLKGGKYISGLYTNCYSKLEWQCNKGHVWKASWTNILSGKWCPICAFKMHTVEEINNSISEVKCISPRYINNVSKLEWQCINGHTWTSTYSNFRMQKFKCPVCKRNLNV